MKKVILIIMLVLLVPFVSAIEGKVEVYSFRAFVGNVRTEADWDSPVIKTEPGAILELQIRLENQDNQTISIDVEGILYEIGGDIEKSKSLTLDEDERKTFVFEYFIPTDQAERTYDLTVTYKYDAFDYGANTTKSYKHTRDFEIDLSAPDVDLDDILLNLTQSIVNEKERTNDLLETVIGLSALVKNLSACQSSLALADFDSSYKPKYELELNTSQSNQIKLTECETNRQNMLTSSQVKVEVAEAKVVATREQKKRGDNTVLLIIAGSIGFYYLKKKKETTGGKGEGEPITGKWS